MTIFAGALDDDEGADCYRGCPCASTAEAAQADEGLYLRLNTGWSFSRDAGGDVQDDVGDTPIIGAGAGYRLNDYLRGDVTLGYRGGYEIDSSRTSGGSTNTASGDISALTGMVSVYADLPDVFEMFTPYVGGGIGFSRNKVDDVDIRLGAVSGRLDGDTKTSFAWHLGGGVGVEVAPGWTVDAGYRYVDLGSVHSADTGTLAGVPVSGVRAEGDLTAHELQIGVRYQF